ncbi:Low-density lipoprotein receptor-related protein 4, partial [Geodia barretti]
MLWRDVTGVFWCSIAMTLLKTCDSTTDSREEPFILLGNGNTIQWISLDGSEGLPLLNDTDYDIIGVDYDIREGWMFWTDVASRTISKAKLDGSNVTILVSDSMRVPDGLAWDWATKKVYWSDAGRKRIEVYDPLRNVRQLLKSTGSQSLPRDIAVDPTTGWLFWTDWGGSPKVERMSMDGTAHTTIISTDIVWPSGLAIDYATHTLFWSDASLDKLESSDFDGQHRRILLERRFIFYPFGLAFFNSTLYWGDWVVGFVYRLSVVDPTDYNYVRPVLESEPTGLKVVSKVNQPQVETPCSTANGECSHLCLISATSPSGYSCACPRHFRLGQNRRDCYSGKQGSEPTAATTEVPPTKGSCVQANYTACCTSDNCQGLPPVCTCSAECHSLGTCCPDIEIICPLSPPPKGFLVVANEDGLVRLELDGRSQSVLVRGERHTTAIDYDLSSNTLFWSDVVLGRIRRSFLNGSDVTTVIGSGRTESPEGIAVDWVNQMLYWTDARAKRIEVFDLEKGHRRLLITTGEGTLPRTIIVDPTTRSLD